jgi:cation transport protein ChaC
MVRVENAMKTEGQELTRELIESGWIDVMAARDAPALRRLSPEEMAESLRSAIAARPPGAAWLFGYGSLIWNPTINAAERRTARVDGWHRAFCLSTSVGRGTADMPGLTLALDAGESCTGVAFRIEDDALEYELSVLWKREMLFGSYVPRWIDVLDEQGVRFGSAIAFTIDTSAKQYAGHLTQEDVVQRLATAKGALGTAAEYLYRTVDGLQSHGIADPSMIDLASLVKAAEASRRYRS